MNYYCMEIRVNTEDAEKEETVAEAIRRYFTERNDYVDTSLIYDSRFSCPSVRWFGRRRLMGGEELQFIESLSRDFKVQIMTNECSKSDGLHTVSWAFVDGGFWKVLDHGLYFNDIDVAHLAGNSLSGFFILNPVLAKSVGTLSLDKDCRDDVYTLLSVLLVIKEMNIQPSNDDVADWLAVRDFIYEYLADAVGDGHDWDEHDGDAIVELISYIETACLKAGCGIESTPRSLAATI